MVNHCARIYIWIKILWEYDVLSYYCTSDTVRSENTENTTKTYAGSFNCMAI